MKSLFSVNELDFKGDSNAEQQRTRVIFERLKKQAIEGKYLSEHEKDFFCRGVVLSLLDDGILEDYECCDNYKFKFLYLVYAHDLTGGSPVYKPNRELQRVAEIDNDEKQKDLQYIYFKSDEWEKIITKTNHQEEVLKEAAKEARTELKNLDGKPEIKNTPFFKGTFRYEHIKREILLKSRYIYCIALKYFERVEEKDLFLEINGQTIEINAYSIIHILNRHFAAIPKYYNTEKSFHNINFEPDILNIQLRRIFKIIDASKFLIGMSLNKISFQFRGIPYQVWTSEKKKFRTGNEITFRRLNTFYPVNDAAELSKLKSGYNLIRITDDISIYIVKIN
jgi:hypothetical protein